MNRIRVKHGFGGGEGKAPVDTRFLIPPASEEELNARKGSPLFDAKLFLRLIKEGKPTGAAEKVPDEKHITGHLTEAVPELDEDARRRARSLRGDDEDDFDIEDDEEDEEPEEFAVDDAAELWVEGLEGGGAGAPVLQQLKYRDVPVLPALSRHGHSHADHEQASHLNDLHSPRFVAGVRGHHGGEHASLDHAPSEGDLYNPLGRAKVVGAFHSHNAGLNG